MIAWPGQVIDKEKIKTALRAGVLQELLDMTVVKLEQDAPADTEAEDTAVESEPEIEVEIIVDDVEEATDAETAAPTEETVSEEDAFIVEEAAKLEAAEQV